MTHETSFFIFFAVTNYIKILELYSRWEFLELKCWHAKFMECRTMNDNKLLNGRCNFRGSFDLAENFKLTQPLSLPSQKCTGRFTEFNFINKDEFHFFSDKSA